MERESILQRIAEERVIAIIRAPAPEALVSAAQALREGGISLIEFTMTTPGALQLIAETRQALSGAGVILGAGTVLDPETARAAILAGAQFIVTPTLNPAVIQLCRRYAVPVIPGAFTPTEMLTAWEAGADLVKVFPASTLGPGYIRSVLAPLPQLRLVPTGGIDEHNAADYLRAGAVAVGVGGKLVSRQAVETRDWETIRQTAARLVAAVRSAR